MRNRLPPRPRIRFGDDDGTLTVYLVVLALALIAAAGLAIDGGAKIEAIAQARDLADNAARVGAQEAQGPSYRGLGRPPINQAMAQAAVAEYLSATDASLLSVTYPTPVEIEVTVEISVDYALLAGSPTVQGVGHAESEQG